MKKSCKEQATEPMPHSSSQLSEFIFGSLPTAEGRLKQAKMARVGLFHDVSLSSIVPLENEPIQITVRVGTEIAVKAVNLHYTTDAFVLIPLWDFDHPSIVTLPMPRTQVEWDTLQGSVANST